MANEILAPDFDDIPDRVLPRSLEDLLSLAEIRAHTKTDDVGAVTDSQLDRYRRAAFEAAEAYTGLLLRERRRLIERVQRPDFDPGRAIIGNRRRVRRITHRLRWGSADGRVWVYGGGSGFPNHPIDVAIGAREVKIDEHLIPRVFDNCCRPCGSTSDAARVLYVAGYERPEDVPSGIILGCLKFIAWCVENPGDTFRPVDDATTRSRGGLPGTNNAAVASGAVDQWRMATGR